MEEIFHKFHVDMIIILFNLVCFFHLFIFKFNFNLFFSESGEVLSFGDNQFGQLGLGNTENQRIPIEIKELKGKRVVQLLCSSISDSSSVLISK
jgi:alpha-tubulin suppressor-like RCC1 family protein